ncbi:uncharacterized protein si:ch211-14c7.2 [Austrofundulus limnaeus]|uniref:Uncharacterized protein si:ch211-14c7.2 n=1 Tax=Austrofundulus limnaeus TaxID=52670 RepID=A0A2I4BUI4_AUSLI|nr:PREDICTED: uncharacterized protein LOC106522784 [Austrofundulus limnaeus]
MRPTSGSMLQQNNNNNYPCLNKSHPAQDILQKCSRTSLLLGDLPLVRGLRAWALCSKNRSRAGGLLGGGKAPTAPPLARRSSTSCPRPADVYLSGELGRMGYGLPLGLDTRALVTVATLKPSEGNGKTQTQCLFLRTQKGSCLYSTAKPSPGGTTGTASGRVGEWLKGKTGGGAESPPTQDGANRVRVRSGRRWRKSGNVATGQEKRERPAEDRQEERDKGPDGRRSSSRTSSASPKTCRRPQRRKSQDEEEGLEKPNVLSRDRQEPNPDPESDQVSSSRDTEEDGELSEEPQIQEDFTETEEDHLETQQDWKPGHGFCQDDEEPETQMESVSSADSLRPQESSAPVGGRVCSPDLELDSSSGPEPVTRDSSKTRNGSVSWGKEARTSLLEEERRTVEGGAGTTSMGLGGAEAEEEEEEEGYRRNTDQDVSVEANTCVFNPGAPFSPAPSLPPLASMATGLPILEAEEEEEHEAERGDERRSRGEELEERVSTVAPEEGTKEEDEFGVFMQAEGESARSEGVNGSASVPCGSRGGVEPGDHAVSDWTDVSLHQSDDTWAAFPQDPQGSGGNVVEQWWPNSAVEAAGNQLWTTHSPASVFAEAFPSPPAASPGDPCDLDAIPTLTQLLGGRAGQDQRLLNHFHDLNKMIGRSYKRASRTSRDLLLKTFHLQQPLVESRPASWTTNRHLSPGLPSANQNAHHAAAKRRLSYDHNRNVVE